MRYDAIVIGAGTNGLTAAGLLAKAGRKVVLLERRDRLGGLGALEEFHPGFLTPGLLHDTAGVRRRVADALQLERHGLKWRPDETPVFAPEESGRGLLLFRDPARAAAEIANHSSRDVDRYAHWRGFLDRIRGFVLRILEEPAPPVSARGLGQMWELASKAIALKRLPDKDLREFLRIGPMCAADWLNEWFESPLLKAALAGPAVSGSWMGPWSAGTVVTLLLQECASGREVEGGPAALTRALEGACRGHGVEIRTSSEARRIRLGSGGAAGVDLVEGGSLEAPVILSSCDPRRTLIDLVAPRDLPPRLELTIRHWRSRGTTARICLALRGPLEFAGRPGGLFEAARTGSELDELERAFDAVKYGEFSRVPILDVRVPTLSDPTLAPPGHHVASILVHFAPYHLNGGWTEERRRALGEAAVARLACYAPDLPERVLAREVQTPADLEERYSLTGGHIHHGEPALDQLFSLRPAASCSRHATPLPGLFLCGSGTHPGGGITCGPGALAASAVLAARG